MFIDALAYDGHYRDRLAGLAKRGVSVDEAIRSLSAYDIRRACTELRDVFESTNGLDGQVSVDLDPQLAGDAASTVREATELFRIVNRPNLLVKIMATGQGISAVRDCVGAGIGVHANDIFSVRRYGEVLDAYFDGLEQAIKAGLRPSTIAAVTSLPVGQIDAEVDVRLDALGTEPARALRAQAALATARLAYQPYEQRLSSERWRELSVAGARPPRLMWTTTTASDPAYPVMWYVNEFVAWGTVNAMPLSMLEAAGRACRLRGDTLTSERPAATRVLEALEQLVISTADLADRLEAENTRRQVDTWLALQPPSCGPRAGRHPDLPTPCRTRRGNSLPARETMGAAFTAVSVNSSSGSDSAMIAPPTPWCTRPGVTTTVRMTTLRSAAPVSEK